MTAAVPSPEEIRRARAADPSRRERDLSTDLGITEGELVAAHCGHGAVRIEPEFDDLFIRLEQLGEVMALTRNEHAVHEKIGVYDKFIPGKHAALMLGEMIDMRMFPIHWKHAFAVEKQSEDGVRHSLQFFDAHGEAVHKIHARPATDLDIWQELVTSWASGDQSPMMEISPIEVEAAEPVSEVPLDELRQRWSRMTDVHQFFGIIRKLKLSRHRAVSSVGEDFAWRISNDSVETMLHRSAAEKLPIMCFIGSRGCIQIHTGPVEKIVPMGPWINVMDPGFHMHLRTDRIAEVWAVRKPIDTGHVTSIEAYDSDRNLIVQFFGERVEGQDEREGWRALVEDLPRDTEKAA